MGCGCAERAKRLRESRIGDKLPQGAKRFLERKAATAKPERVKPERVKR